jgi:hypothetical protein
MSEKATQYTIRSVPARVDRALRRKARERGISLNRLALEALVSEAGVGPETATKHDLDRFFGTWVKDEKVDEALADQRRVDLKDWT